MTVLEDAKKVVWQTRFYPVGRRAVDGGNADGAYCMVDFQEYIKTANEQRFVVVQIEDPEPLNELEAICELPGIDMIFFGPGDFSHGIGAPGEWDHPKLTETRKRIAEVAIAHGKVAGTVGNPDNAKDLVAMGYRFINLGNDVVTMGDYCRKLMEAADKSPAPKIASLYGKT